MINTEKYVRKPYEKIENGCVAPHFNSKSLQNAENKAATVVYRLVKYKMPKGFPLEGIELDRVISLYNDYVESWNAAETKFCNYVTDLPPSNGKSVIEQCHSESWGLRVSVNAEKYSIENEIGFWTPQYRLLTYRRWKQYYKGWDWHKNTISIEDIKSAKVFFRKYDFKVKEGLKIYV